MVKDNSKALVERRTGEREGGGERANGQSANVCMKTSTAYHRVVPTHAPSRTRHASIAGNQQDTQLSRRTQEL